MKEEKTTKKEGFWEEGYFAESMSEEEMERKQRIFHMKHDEEMNYNCGKCGKIISAHNMDWHDGMCDQCFNREQFVERWKKWCECFGDDPNSVNNQIIRMLSDYAIWNMVNKSRSYSEKYPDGRLTINHQLHHSIDGWFFQTQMAAIRRLIDTSELEGQRGVYSLVSIINEMIAFCDFLTRENIFEIRKMPYDTESLKEAERKWINENCKSGEVFQVPPEFDWHSSEDLHIHIDILSRTNPENRSPNDKIDVNFLKKVKDELCCECRAFKIIVDKTVAHAATEESRGDEYDKLKPKISDILKAQEIFYKYANFIQTLLTGTTVGFLPIPGPGLFTNWDKPLFQGKDEKILQEIWDKYNERTQNWVLGFEELKKMMVR